MSTGGQHPKFKEGDLQNTQSVGRAIVARQISEGPPRYTSRSLSGVPQQTVTAHTMSDVLQGALSVKGPEDVLLVLNNALTTNLEALYNAGLTDTSVFSTMEPPPGTFGQETHPNFQGGTGGGVFDATGIQVRESWVNSLPLEHTESGAIIWQPEGEASFEMHLPVSGDIEEDMDLHLQDENLPSQYQHPYYMDRVQPGHGFNPWSKITNSEGKRVTRPAEVSGNYTIGWAGGKSYVGSSGATIGNEDPELPGSPGAYASYYTENGGYMTREAEQWYISSSWAFDDRVDDFIGIGRSEVAEKARNIRHSAYAFRRVLVYNPSNSRAVVCTPGDWGPNVNIGHIVGLPPDVHHVLETIHGSTVKIAFMPDDTPLGPYKPKGNEALAPGGSGGVPVGSIPDANSGEVLNTIEEIKYASQKILNHPNNRLDEVGSMASGFRTMMTGGAYGAGNNPMQHVIYQEGGRGFMVPSLLNYLFIIFEAGFILGNFLGALYNRNTSGGSLSYHAHGGAIDIGSAGLASENVLYPISGKNSDSRRVVDQLFTYLSTLSTEARANEHGNDWAQEYDTLGTYPDDGHIHLGFSKQKIGHLMDALKRPTIPHGLSAQVNENTGG